MLYTTPLLFLHAIPFAKVMIENTGTPCILKKVVNKKRAHKLELQEKMTLLFSNGFKERTMKKQYHERHSR